jgi:hypothetical protein
MVRIRMIGGTAAAVVSALLIGCAGAPSVTKVGDNPTSLPGKGVFYYLPKTQLELTLELTREDIARGDLSRFIGECALQSPLDSLCAREAKFKFKQKTSKVAEKHRFFQCDRVNDKDTTQIEFQRIYSFTQNTKVVGIPVADRTNLYFVEVTPAWYQTLTLNMAFSDNGFANEMTMGGTNVVPDIFSKAIGTIGTVFMSVDKNDELSELWRAIEAARRAQDLNNMRKATLDALDAIAARKKDLLLNAPVAGDPTAILAALDADAAKLRAVYEGELDVKTVTMVRREMLKVGSAELTAISSVDQEIGINHDLELSGCAEKDQSSVKVPLHLKLMPDRDEAAIALAQKASEPTLDDKKKGFRYRIPIPVDVTLHRVNPPDHVDSEAVLDRKFPVEIAQLGPTLALPRKAGIWGGTIAASFVPGTGRLKGFKTDASNNGAAQIVTSVATEAARDRELEELERKSKELEFRQKIQENTQKLEAAGAL